MIGKYAWSFDENEKIWNHSTHISIEDCMEDAAQYAEKYMQGSLPKIVFIGENVPFFPIKEFEDALEKSGRNDCLSSMLTDWIEKYKRGANFYRVENIKEYPLKKRRQTNA